MRVELRFRIVQLAISPWRSRPRARRSPPRARRHRRGRGRRRRGGERRARLRHRRGQLERRQLGDDVAGADAVALLDLDGRELAADLGRDADLGRAHDADDRRRRLGAPQQIPAERLPRRGRGRRTMMRLSLALAMRLPPLDQTLRTSPRARNRRCARIHSPRQSRATSHRLAPSWSMRTMPSIAKSEGKM